MPETPTGARWERLLSARDASLIDAGAIGERTVARARLVITAILAIIPIQSVLEQPGRPENWVGIIAVGTSLVIAVVVLWVLRRGFYRPWLSVATSVYDVTSVSAILVTFIAIGLPQIAVNSRVVFEIYLLALSATCLRYDRNTPLIAGAIAVVEYGAIVFAVRPGWDLSDARYAGYGAFSWADQMGRILVLATASVLAWAILRRAERLRQLSTHDPLTGLLNRNVLEERVREEVMRARRYARPLSVAMVDLDLFKRFNDAFGHATGDVALRAVSRTLREAVRRTDIVARFGGEEFVLVLPETLGPDAVLKLDQIRRTLEAMHLDLPGAPDGRVTLSAGVASLDPERDHSLEILQRADDLLMAAKRAGRNCVMSESGRIPSNPAPGDGNTPTPSRVDGNRGLS
ncbi:MAG TPA: diguanylate cyclase [Gemmatimonadaceae bacterium]|nr:diguanylate cyclase [Gemmatimonadaceae bacterium]